MDYLQAADHGLEGLVPVWGEDPMGMAWNRTLSWVIDRSIEANPSVEGAIRMVDFKVDPGVFPVRKDLSVGRRSLSVLLGAIAGWIARSYLLPGGEAASGFSVFLLTSFGALMGTLLCSGRSVLDLDQARTRLALLAQIAHGRIEALDAKDVPSSYDLDPRLGRALVELKASPREELEAAAEALLIEASNSGYKGLGGTPAFCGSRPPRVVLVWNQGMRTRYDTFGHYEDGDKVVEERPPVMVGEEVLQKGMVRRAGR